MIKLGVAPVDSDGKVKERLIPLSNGRELDQKEIESEEKAKSLPKGKFRRIQPVPGTLAHLLRDIEGGNQSVIEYVRQAINEQTRKYQPQTNPGKANKIIKLWESFDEFSKNRIDVFDWLCDEVGLKKQKFYAFAAEGMYNHYEAISQRILLESKPELLHNVRQFARKERNSRDRELLAKATGVTKDAPLIGSIDNSTKIQHNITYESNFRSVLKDTEKIINESDIVDAEIVENERRALNPANMEHFVDANLFKEEKEEEYVERRVEIK